MSTMNCRSVRREIDEAAPGEALSLVARDHVKNCIECTTFSEKHLKLQKMVSSLGPVEVPGDFDFKLRARLAGEKPGSARPFAMRNLSVSFRSAALAIGLLLVGSALLFVRLRTPVDKPQLAVETKVPSNQKESTASEQAGNDRQASEVAAGSQTTQPGAIDVINSSESPTQRRNASRKLRPEQVASGRDNERQRTRDLSSTQAAVFRPTEQVARAAPSIVFPIDASYQSLRVLFDDGRGSARTISVPKVSFGSQRVLGQSTSQAVRGGSW